jgi:hypothetical protein
LRLSRVSSDRGTIAGTDARVKKMRTMVGCGSVNESICMYSCVLYTVLLLIFPNIDIDTCICETLKCDMEFIGPVFGGPVQLQERSH